MIHLELLENVEVLLGHDEWEHGIDGISTVVVGQSSHEKIIRDVALGDLWVRLDLSDAPVGQIGWRVVLDPRLVRKLEHSIC